MKGDTKRRRGRARARRDTLKRAVRRAKRRPRGAVYRLVPFISHSDVAHELRDGQPIGHCWQKTRWNPNKAHA